MRQITFGPTQTNYFDLDEDDDDTPQNDPLTGGALAHENNSERLNQRFV